jgi:hypothetical protein
MHQSPQIVLEAGQIYLLKNGTYSVERFVVASGASIVLIGLEDPSSITPENTQFTYTETVDGPIPMDVDLIPNTYKALYATGGQVIVVGLIGTNQL